VLRRSGAERLLVSDSDILDGIAWSLVDQPHKGLPSR
jgi:hypothetical protein